MVFKMQLIFTSFLIMTSTITAQDCNDFSNFPNGEIEGKKVHVLYRDFIKKEQYESAYPMWKKLMEYAPAGNLNHFIDGVNIYSALIEKELDNENEEKVGHYRKKVVALYEQRLNCMCHNKSDSSEVMELMAFDLAILEYEDVNKTLEIFDKAITMNGNSTSAYILEYYADHITYLFSNDIVDRETARSVYYKLETIKNANIGKQAYTDSWAEVENDYKPYTQFIFTCEDIIKKLKPQYEADSDNRTVFRNILRQLLEIECSQEEPFVAELIEKDRNTSTGGDGGCTLRTEVRPDNYVDILVLKGKPDEAILYFKKALRMDIGKEDLAKTNYALAKIYHQKGEYSKARRYYFAAAKERENWGEPYIQIGKMYASSVRSCGDNSAFQQGVVICAALDMWEKAKSIDPSVTEQANKLSSLYAAHVPTKEDAFQRGVNEGNDVSVYCWIGGTVKLRLRSQY